MPERARGGSRRYHPKSRNGCAQCKKTRKKCDERPPVCGRCEQRGLTCEYESMRPNLPVPGRESSRSPSKITSPASSSELGLPSSAGETLQSSLGSSSSSQPFIPEAQLMGHYQSLTCLTLAAYDHFDYFLDYQEVWKITLTLEAEHHRFLWHEILAISALHCAHSFPEEATSYAFNANWHHDKAMSLFHASGTIITEGNAIAVLGFAFMQVIYRFGSPFIPGHQESVDVIDSFLGFTTCLGLFWKLLPEAKLFIKDEHVKVLMSQENLIPDLPPNELYANLFEALDATNQLSFDSEEDKMAYQDSAKELQRLYAMPFIPPTWNLILSWPLRTPTRLMELIRERKPLALIHLAYWCVPIHYSVPQWCLREWCPRLVLAIRNSLDPEFLSLMEWPLGQIDVSDFVPTVRSTSTSDFSNSLSPPSVSRRPSDQ